MIVSVFDADVGCIHPRTTAHNRQSVFPVDEQHVVTG